MRSPTSPFSKTTKAINGLYSKNTLEFFRNNKDISAYPAWDESYEEIYKRSIFKDIEMFHSDLSRIIEVNGVRIGTDKIAHFFGMGFLYWLNYKKTYIKYKRRIGHEAAHIRAVNSSIKLGIKAEKGIIGWKSQQTASFADLEANYQGLKFFLDFCSGENPMVKAQKIKGKKKWVLQRSVDFRDYVNPWWDETFYSNLYLPEAFNIIKPKMLKYCDMRKSSIVEAKFDYYRSNFTPTYGVRYLSELIENGELEDNNVHSLDRVCDEKERQDLSRQQR